MRTFASVLIVVLVSVIAAEPLLVMAQPIAAQDATIHVEVRRESAPVADASVTTTITIVAGQRREVIVELQPTLHEEISARWRSLRASRHRCMARGPWAASST